MSIIKGIVKSAVVLKAAQLAQRELSKPENQRKIKNGLHTLQQAARRRP